ELYTLSLHDALPIFFREADGLFDGCHVDVEAADHVVNPHGSKHLRRTLRLIRFNSHFVGGYFLVIFLTQDGNHIERGASGKPGRSEEHTSELQSLAY